MEAKAPALQFELVPRVTSGGHRQWQQWEVRSHGMRHYNNKGNLKVNRRTSRWKPRDQTLFKTLVYEGLLRAWRCGLLFLK